MRRERDWSMRVDASCRRRVNGRVGFRGSWNIVTGVAERRCEHCRKWN
jgi:hypothetical protein